MSDKAIFSGLVVDEFDRIVEVVTVGEEACYVVDDAGFKRHIPAHQVDKQVLEALQGAVEGHESMISEQTAKMLGQDDIFTRAMIESQLRNMDQHLEALYSVGIPEESRAYMGMLGFRIIINFHGDVIEITQPGAIDNDEE